MAPLKQPLPVPNTMSTWLQSQPGLPASTCTLTDVRLSSLPTETSVLVRVSHVALHPGTATLMKFAPSMFRRFPAVPETDFSGVVVETGSQVSTTDTTSDSRSFPIGTPVFGSIDVPTHLRLGRGALAQYVAVESSSLARKPDNVSFAEAAGLGVSAIAAVALVDAAKDIPQNPRMLINAACGGVGHFATKLLRYRYPSGHIVGICSGKNEDLAKKFGCNEVIDYTAFPNAEGQTLVQYIASRYGSGGDNGPFDAIFDAYGSQDLWEFATAYLKSGPHHPYVSVGPRMEHSWFAFPGFLWKVTKNLALPSWLGGVPRTHKQVATFTDTESLENCRKLAQDGIFNTHIGGMWELDQALDAYEKSLSGHASGKVIVKVWDPETADFAG
ncbi:hypothetical protein VTO42DRAFT_3613 [Malbranchea cinnamomea]